MRLVQTRRLSDFSIGLAFTHRSWLLPAFDGRVKGNIDRYLRPIGSSLFFWLNRNCEIAGSTAFRLQESRIAMNEREPIPLLEWKNRHSPADADLLVIAERELGAFIRAVTELFRPH